MIFTRCIVLMGVCVTMLFLPGHLFGQSLAHDWSSSFGASQVDEGMGIAIDEQGNIIVVGYFCESMDMGVETLASEGFEDIFLVKFNETGMYQWGINIGSTSADYGLQVAVDLAGNIFITGSAKGIVHLGGEELTPAGGNDILLAKFDGNGAHLWSKMFGGILEDMGLGVAADDSGNVCITGFFWDTIDLGGGPLTSSGEDDLFIAKFNSNGSHLWSHRFGSTGNDGGSACAMDALGNVFVTGAFESSIDFDGHYLSSFGSRDIFVVKFDMNGNHVWSTHCGGSSWDMGMDLSVDEFGNTCVTGMFSGTGNFGSDTFISSGGTDIFLVKYDDTGEYLWGKRFGNTLSDEGYGICADSTGDVFVTGHVTGSVDFGGGILTSAGGYDIFIAAFGSTGDHLWSDIYGDVNWQEGYGIEVDGAGSVALTGFFYDTVNFGGESLVSEGSQDVYVSKFTSPQVPIFISSFVAVAEERGIQLSWNLTSDEIVKGFRIFRKTSGETVIIALGTGGLLEPDRRTYIDKEIRGGLSYEYTLGVVKTDGSEILSQTITIESKAYTLALYQNHPNPFNPTTTISFTLPKESATTLVIYNLEGRLVSTLVDAKLDEGYKEVTWNGTDSNGNPVSSGVYFYRLKAGGKTLTKKMVLLK